jgi:hypothetical protein
MTGPTKLLVTKASATHFGLRGDSRKHVCAIARTHSDMVKFSPHDHDYDAVLNRLSELTSRALSEDKYSSDIQWQNMDDLGKMIQRSVLAELHEGYRY